MIRRRRTPRKTFKMKAFRSFRSDVIDPRRRSRQRRFFLKAAAGFALAAGLGYGLAVGYRALPVASLFEIKKVEITGLERLSPGDLEPLIALQPSQRLPDIDLREVHGRLMEHPWIRDAQVRKTYPDTLAIRVVERRPFAVVQGDSGDVLVDETGKVLEKVSGSAENGKTDSGPPANPAAVWPRFTGLGPVSSGGAGFQDRPAFRRAVQAVADLNRDPPGAETALSVDVRDRKELVVHWDGYRLRFGPDRVKEGWERFLSVQKDILERKPKIKEIDLRFPDYVIVR